MSATRSGPWITQDRSSSPIVAIRRPAAKPGSGRSMCTDSSSRIRRSATSSAARAAASLPEASTRSRPADTCAARFLPPMMIFGSHFSMAALRPMAARVSSSSCVS